MITPTKIDQLRERLIAMQKEQDFIIMEKGLTARDNNDLRENAAYDYWCEKEAVATAKILNLIKEIEELAKNGRQNSF